MKVKFSDIDMAFEFADFGDDVAENLAWIDRETGQVHAYTETLGDEEGNDPPPEDLGDSERYVSIPGKRDLDLGTRLVFAFVGEAMPDDYDEVRAIFSKRGAYGRFKGFLAGRGMLDQWYAFENAAEEAALRAWCEAEGIELADEG